MSHSVRPHRQQPIRLPHPWGSTGNNTGVGCQFLLQCMKVKSESEVAQSCLTLSDPMDCSLPGSSIHGIFQAKVLEWGAIAFSIIKRLFSSSSLSAIGVVLSIYLRLLIFLQSILIPACFSSSPAFHMIYFASKLNKQGDNIQPLCTLLLIWKQSVVPCPVLTAAS